MRQLIEEKNNLAIVFMDLKKAYNWVPSEVLWKVLKRKGGI